MYDFSGFIAQGPKCKKPAQGGYILSGLLCDFKERFLPETPGTDFLCGEVPFS
jgi:hypothetical protein